MDLSDDFYQFILAPTVALKLATPFPNLPDKLQIFAIPTVLPMGWTKSPPAFSEVTETVAYIINETLETSTCVPPAHPLELTANVVPTLLPSDIDFHPITDTARSGQN